MRRCSSRCAPSATVADLARSSGATRSSGRARMPLASSRRSPPSLPAPWSSLSMILAGDIGGTKTVLALYDELAAPLIPVREAPLASRQYARFDDVLRSFLRDRDPSVIAAACFGVA